MNPLENYSEDFEKNKISSARHLLFPVFKLKKKHWFYKLPTLEETALNRL